MSTQLRPRPATAWIWPLVAIAGEAITIFPRLRWINIYEDQNAYVNSFGFERPAMRTLDGETRYTVRHECQVENVLGRGGNWAVGGKDWCAWNATFGPRGADGLPKPLWNGRTGAIDRSVVEHWKQYDLRLSGATVR